MGLPARSRTRVGASCVGASLLAVLSTSGPAAAAPKPITGKLSKPGYSVIALAPNGRATLARTRRGAFRVRPPARSVTLHLRAPDGTYAGPIVAGRRGSRAIVGVRAGARLGRVSVRRGHARPSRRLRRTWVDARRTARARRGVPIGAGRFGRVRSRRTRGGVPGDLDLDGIPDVLDIDDNGNLILDDFDLTAAARSSQAEDAFHVFSDLSLFLHHTVNRHAGSTDAEIDSALPRFGILRITVLPGDSAELDCGGANQLPARPEGLVYCTRGGTGQPLGGPPPQEFPECCDLDGDGFGTLDPSGRFRGFGLAHGATTAQIGTGDVLVQWVATGVPESQCPPLSASCASFPSKLQFVFATVPALVSFSDGQGPPVTVSYPVPEGTGPSNAFPVAADPTTGDVILTLTFWRPQRRPIPGEAGYSDPPTAWTDVGGLAYTAAVADIGGVCPQTVFSQADPPDPNLTPATPESAPKVFNMGRGGFLDRALDQPANPANTFTYRLNLTQCLAAHGLSFNPGEVRGMDFQGITPNFGGVADQLVYFRRQ